MIGDLEKECVKLEAQLSAEKEIKELYHTQLKEAGKQITLHTRHEITCKNRDNTVRAEAEKQKMK